MVWPAIVLCALAVSVDALAAGWAYGLRGAVVSGLSLLVVALTSVAFTVCALTAGGLLGAGLEAEETVVLGSLVLLFIGGWILLETWLKATALKHANGRVWRWRISSLGLVVQVMREPTRADLDNSGRLNGGKRSCWGWL